MQRQIVAVAVILVLDTPVWAVAGAVAAHVRADASITDTGASTGTGPGTASRYVRATCLGQRLQACRKDNIVLSHHAPHLAFSTKCMHNATKNGARLAVAGMPAQNGRSSRGMTTHVTSRPAASTARTSRASKPSARPTSGAPASRRSSGSSSTPWRGSRRRPVQVRGRGRGMPNTSPTTACAPSHTRGNAFADPAFRGSARKSAPFAVLSCAPSLTATRREFGVTTRAVQYAGL